MKIWIKLQKGDKTPGHTVVEMPNNATYEDFIQSLRDGCRILDTSTPTVLLSHYKRFMRFGTVRFYPDDFIDNINYDKMEIELFRAKKQHTPSIFDV